MNKHIFCTLLFLLSNLSDADNNINLNDIHVVATKLDKSASSGLSIEAESGNFIPLLTSAAPNDTAHTTTQELNNMAGISILGGNQTINQNISIGGLNDDNIFIGIDGLNNYFSNFGHNQARLLPSASLFKTVTASQTGSDITNGSGNIGGAVNFTTLDPEDLLHGDKLSTQATVGANSATTGTNANAALAARTGKVSYLIDVVASHDNDMQLGNGSTLPYSANTNLQLLSKIGIDISKAQSIKVAFLGMENQGQYPTTINNLVSGTNPPANYTFKQTQTTVDYGYKPDNPYFDIKAKVFYQTSGYMAIPINNGGGFVLPQNIAVNTDGLKLNNTTIVARQHLLYGLEFTNISGSDGYSSNTVLNFPTANQQLYGAYLQDSWDITRKINLTAGTRYNSYQSQSSGYTNNGTIFTNQIGLKYQFLKNWLAFAGYAEGFRAPTIQELYLGGNHPFTGPAPFLTIMPNPNLNPELAQNKTAGIKYDTNFTSDQHFMVSATGFLNDVSNYILNSYVGQNGPTAINQNINIPTARLYGYILALNYTTPWFNLDTNFTSTYGTTMSNYSNPNGKNIPAGSALPIPQAKGFLGLGFPINAIDSTIQGNINYALSQNMTPQGVPDVPGYVLVGLAYHYQPKRQLKGLDIVAGIDNLFNQNYQNYDGQNLFPALGRNIYAQIGYKY